jgi:hypothetical protein
MVKVIVIINLLLGFVPIYAQTAVPDSVKASTYYTDHPYSIMTWKRYKNGIMSYIRRGGYKDTIQSKTDYYINEIDSSIIVDGKKVYLKCDKAPHFPKLKTYFEKNQPRIYTNMETILWVGAIVHEDGGLSHIGILRLSSMLYTIPAFEMILKMPRWNPGELNGQKVNAYVVFRIDLWGGM